MKNIIGRKEELETLAAAFSSRSSEFMAVYGRRRVGKTFLIHHYFNSINGVYFPITGIKNGTFEEQLDAFNSTLSKVFYNDIKLERSKNWFAALEALTKAIAGIRKNRKIVLFFDEFPWMVTRRSRLLQALEYYWNHTWAFEGRIKLIICGSSSSWILKNIIHNTGGLYNRVTKRIGLEPFTLSETQAFLESKGIRLSHKRVTELYMVMGGVPFYLSQVQKSQSTAQIIDTLFFNKKSSLYNEYQLLLSALFEQTKDYDFILRTIANYRYGLSQADLLKKPGVPQGGRSITRLKELEDVGFVQSYIPMGHKEKGKYYKIVDEYLLFYLHWIEPNLRSASRMKNIWQSRALTSTWKIWSGYTFESICYKHIEKIADKLNVGPGARASSWRFVPIKASVDQGAQIDLLFERDDDAITLCEIKYTEEPFAIDKQYAEKLKQKTSVFKKVTRTNKQIFLALVSANGIKKTMYSEEMIDGVVTLDNLF
jgi:AAA+ ATPase superfamily predicted ATPase